MAFTISIGKKFRFTSKELFEMLVSAAVITFIFGYADFKNASPDQLLRIGAIYFPIIGLAFIFHETAHKLTAQSFGCWSEYRMWAEGLIIALVLRLTLGFTFIAPGAAYFSPFKHGIPLQQFKLTKREVGWIGIAGPLINIVLGVLFYIAWLFGILPLAINGFSVLLLGAYVNFMLAFFNMLPIPPLDGSKVWRWSPILYISVMGGLLVGTTVMGLPLI